MKINIYGVFSTVFLFAFFSACGSHSDSETAHLPVTTMDAIQKQAPEWSQNATIYEVNLRQFSDAGTIAAFQESLPRLKKMGVKILWLMPIQPIGEKNRKGTLGSYYSIKNYTAVNPEFGTLADFKNMVRAAHESGMFVILDWVANHTAWDHPWVSEHPDWFTRDSAGNMQPPVADWYDVVDLNYENHDMRAAMLDALKFWVRETDIDGFRCDIAEMVPLDFWRAARSALDVIKPVFMLAEGEKAALHEAFDMTYGSKFHHLLNGVAMGENTANDLAEHIILDEAAYPADAYRMQFTTNHDENSWNGTVFERLGDGAEACAVLSGLVPDMPLVYNGQESGMDKRLDFFEKDPIEWREHHFFEIYKILLNLNLENKALWNGKAGGTFTRIAGDNDTAVLAFTRANGADAVTGIFNLSGEHQSVQLSEAISGNFREPFSAKPAEINAVQQNKFDLNPWEYRVFVKP